MSAASVLLGPLEFNTLSYIIFYISLTFRDDCLLQTLLLPFYFLELFKARVHTLCSDSHQ